MERGELHPKFDHAPEELSAYYRSVTVGDLACILSDETTWAAKPSFRFARVNEVRPRQGSIVTDVGMFFCEIGREIPAREPRPVSHSNA